jgi:hypothetical protein
MRTLRMPLPLMWSLAIASRYAAAVRPGSPNERTLLRAAQFWLLRWRTTAPALQVVVPISGMTAPRNRDRLVIASANPTMFSRHTTFFNTPPVHKTFYRNWTTSQASALVRNSTNVFQSSVHRHLAFTTLIAGKPASWKESGAQVEWAGRLPVLEPLNSAMPQTARRILKQGCRVEEQIVHAATVLLRRSIPAASERSWMEEQPIPVRPAQNGYQTWTTPVTAQTLNFQQITDEVVKQLDRRLIASRERFGKI